MYMQLIISRLPAVKPPTAEVLAETIGADDRCPSHHA